MSQGDRYRSDLLGAHLKCDDECIPEDADGPAWHHDSHELGAASLYHQCGRWVIGGPEEVRAMIADLQALLVEMEKAGETHE